MDYHRFQESLPMIPVLPPNLRDRGWGENRDGMEITVSCTRKFPESKHGPTRHVKDQLAIAGPCPWTINGHVLSIQTSGIRLVWLFSMRLAHFWVTCSLFGDTHIIQKHKLQWCRSVLRGTWDWPRQQVQCPASSNQGHPEDLKNGTPMMRIV